MNFVFSTNLSIKNMIRMLEGFSGWSRIKRRLTNSLMSLRVLLIPGFTKRKHPRIMLNKRSYLIRLLTMTLKLHHNSREKGLQMPNLMFLIQWKMLLDKRVI
jgi:hypothetical protein